MNAQELSKIKEAVEVLMGWRGSGEKAALLRSQLAGLQSLIANLKTGAAALEKSLASVNSDLSDTKRELKTTQDDVESAKTSIGDINDNLEGFQRDIVTALTGLAAVGDSVEALQARQDVADGALQALSDELSAIRQNASDTTVPAITSTPLDAPPTSEDFNVLLENVSSLREAVEAIRAGVA